MLLPAVGRAQIEIPSLFEYVVAPEDLPDLESRTNYIMENFWKPMDFKNTQYVDQQALNHAFSVYAESMPYASWGKVKSSVQNLVNNLKGNPGLSYQFTRAAEESLYGPRADFWVDEIYLSFVNNMLADKKIAESKKERYRKQKAILQATEAGSKLPEIGYIPLSDTHVLKPEKGVTVIGFLTAENPDNDFVKLQLDINGTINDMLEDGQLALFLVYDKELDKEQLKDFKKGWNVGFAREREKKLDLRTDPSFYILDKDFKILKKNLAVDQVAEYLRSTDSTTKNTSKKR